MVEEIKGPSKEELEAELATVNSQMDEGVPVGWSQKWEHQSDDTEIEQAISDFFSVASKFDI